MLGLVMAAASCAPAVEPVSSGTPGAVPDPPTSTADESGPVAGDAAPSSGATELTAADLPLSALRFGDTADTTGGEAATRAEQILTARCMAARGFEYPPPGQPEDASEDATTGMDEPTAPTVGIDPDYELALGGDPEAWVAIPAADGSPTGSRIPPPDSCVGQAWAELAGSYERSVSLSSLVIQIGQWQVGAAAEALDDPAL
ncbi:MAG: hypothetical protein D6683_06030, partial [Actinomyces sp.]